MEIDTSHRQNRAQRAAQHAEQDAQKRIESAQRRVREAEQEAQQMIERQRDSYEKSYEMERAKQEASLDQKRLEGYERLRDTQREYDRHQAKAAFEGERKLNEVRHDTSTALQTAEHEGEKKLKQTLVQNYRQQEALRDQNQQQLDTFEEDFSRERVALQRERDQTVQELHQRNETERKKMQELSHSALQTAKDHYGETYRKTLDRQQEVLSDLNRKAGEALVERRLSTAHRLDAYSDRQQDPFYKLVNLDADVSETSDAFVLTARIPEHEQDRIQINVRGDQIVVSGQRRNEERVQHSPGHVQTTSSYQSFSESFPINWPVEPKGMMREFSGDQLTVIVPKKTTYSAAPYKAKKEARLASVEQPPFPKNLPGERELQQKVAEKIEETQKLAAKDVRQALHPRRTLG